MKLYLIRHAQSANNAAYTETGIDGRVPDPEITAVGHEQAQRLAQQLANPEAEPRQPRGSVGNRGFGLTHLYCSLMTRTILTGGYIAEACQLPLVAHADLFERCGVYGENEQGELVGLAGSNRDYFSTRFPTLALPDSLGEQGWWSRPMETDAQFVERITAVVADIWQRHGQSDDVVGLVVHGDFIDQYLNELLGRPRQPANYHSRWEANWAFHNTSVSRIDFVGDSPIVVYLNRIDHLPTELVTW